MRRADFAAYFPAGVFVPDEWRAPMEDQFDAVLYLGPMSSLTFTGPSVGPCSDPAFEERLRRMSLNPPSRTQIDRLRQTCSK